MPARRMNERRGIIFAWDRMGTSAATQDDLDRALRFPEMGWPANGVHYGLDGPGPHRARKIFGKKDFRNSPHARAIFRKQESGPTSMA